MFNKLTNGPMRYESYIEKTFHVVGRAGTEIQCMCIYHDDSSGHLYINGESGLFICFSCGHTGSLARIKDIDKEAPYTVEQLLKAVELLNSPPQASKYYRESWLAQFDYPTDYWSQTRGLPQEVIEKFNLGYDLLTDRATIPLRDSTGRILGVTYRRLDGGQPRYRHPKGFPTGKHLFGAWLLNGEPTVALCEGQIDAIRGWAHRVPAVATMGARLTNDQTKLLLKLGVKKVVVMYDNDVAGRKGTLNVYSHLADTGIAVTVGWYRSYWRTRNNNGDLVPLKDPDSLNERRYRKMYHSGLDFTRWFDEIWVPHAEAEETRRESG